MPVYANLARAGRLAFFAAACGLAIASAPAADRPAEAMRLLHSNCLGCHSAEKHKGDLILLNSCAGGRQALGMSARGRNC